MSKVALNWDRLKISDRLILAQNVHQNITANAGTFATPDVAMATFLTGIDAFSLAQQAMIDGGRSKTIARDQAMDKVYADLQKLANYVQNLSDGDPAIIVLAGMTIKRQGPPQYDLIVPPTELRAVNRKNSGELTLYWKRVAYAKNYVVESCIDAITEDGWKLVDYSTRSRFIAKNLQPGRKLWFRVKATSPAGSSSWSEPLSAWVS
jgi:hypothetical protein